MAGGSGSESAGRHEAHSNIYVAFVPWVLFSVIARRWEVEAAAVAALVAAVAISIPGFRAGRPKVLEIGAIVAFVGFTIVATQADAATNEWLARYARGIAAGLLALIAFGSLLRTPFTEQYARETVPEELWSTPTFVSVNRRITALWAWVFLLMVPSHILAGAIDTHRAQTIFNWIVPIVLVVIAVKQTSRLSEGARDEDTVAAA